MEVTLFKPQYINELGKRENQEDSVFPSPKHASGQSKCFVLCDGMGGLDAGEKASSVVSKSFGEYVERTLSEEDVFTDEMFEKALSYAYDQLDNASAACHKQEMGTTLATLCFHAGGCLAAYIGDSRIYHFRPSTDEILYRSRDHSLVYQMFEEGEISLDEMKTSPQRNVILRAMLPNPKPRTVADLIHIKDIAPGDYFLVGSDGLFESIEDATIMEILKSDGSDEEKRDKIKRLSEENDDNHSAYILHVKDVTVAESDSCYPDDEREARDANKVLREESLGADVTVVESTQADDTGLSPQEESHGGENVNMHPLQLKNSGERLSFIIVALTLVAIAAAILFYVIHK